ncbi:MAG: type III pantothenate kinase [Bacteroidota bacterium]|nr:type III pantothenate kinase [Bacteroidota bacterium]
MMNLIVDVGNSFTKIAFFKDERIDEIFVKDNHSDMLNKEMDLLLLLANKCDSALISSVKRNYPEVIKIITADIKNVKSLGVDTILPMTNRYKTPKTLGKDRIAAAVGANNIYPDSNVLIIDAGTALTMDLVTDKNEYIGGSISPGLSMRYRALNRMTGNLPELSINNNFDLLVGTDTTEAITAGVQNGIIYEVESYIDKISEKYQQIKIVLTGGDIIFFERYIKKDIFADQYLVLKGLNRILRYNEK